jgi:PPOX class probable F420-dependent enzyme
MRGLDTSTPFGERVERRLRQEVVIWLVTTSADGTPQPSLVWFLWDGEDVLVYSRPNTPKVRNVQRSSRVAVHFDSDGTGGNVIVLEGEGRSADDTPPADQLDEYLAKYRERIAGIGMTPETFARGYSVPIRLRPEKLRGH